MRSLFLIVLLNFFFFYCSPTFAQSIRCDPTLGGGFSCYVPAPMTEAQRESARYYLCSISNSAEVCLREAAKREAKRSGVTTKPAYVPSVTCEQNSKNNTECFDKVTGRKWEIVP